MELFRIAERYPTVEVGPKPMPSGCLGVRESLDSVGYGRFEACPPDNDCDRAYRYGVPLKLGRKVLVQDLGFVSPKQVVAWMNSPFQYTILSDPNSYLPYLRLDRDIC